MFGWIWKKVQVTADEVAALRCRNCGHAGLESDGAVHEPLYSFEPGFERIRGALFTYCADCNVGYWYHVTAKGIAFPPRPIQLDETPRIEWLMESVDLDHLLTKFEAAREGKCNSEFAIQLRMFRHTLQPTDEIRWFAGSHGPLAFRAGYAIVRNGQPICSILTIMS